VGRQQRAELLEGRMMVVGMSCQQVAACKKRIERSAAVLFGAKTRFQFSAVEWLKGHRHEKKRYT
jgi:hypothetical protein